MPTKDEMGWPPFGEPLSLHKAFDRLLEGDLVRPEALRAALETGAGILPLDMYEEGNSLVVKAALPGLRAEEVKIQVQGDVLTISGENKQKQARHDKPRNYRLREQSYGRLERTVALPVAVDASKAEAVFADGILTLTLPKSQVTPPTRIAIKATEAAPQASAEEAPQAGAEQAPQASAEQTPQSGPEETPQAGAEAVPQASAEAVPQAGAEEAPQASAEAVPQAGAEEAPQAGAAAAPQPSAEETPQAGAETAPQQRRKPAPKRRRKAAPQAGAEAAPQSSN